MEENTTVKKKTTKKDPDWEELYNYVKIELLGYKNKKLPQKFILRLLGLKDGKFMANNKISSQAVYPFKTILLTFKLCRAKIDSYMASTTFKDESHMINGIMVIIESEINNTVDILERKRKAEEKSVTVDVNAQYSDQANYKTKGVITKNEKIRGLL